MTSILTNNSSLVALQTLKNINANMGKVQNEISTGMKVATAKDNGAVWAIAQVMKSDISGLGKVGEALSLGSATVGTGSYRSRVDLRHADSGERRGSRRRRSVERGDTRTKLVADLTAIGNQIIDIVASASFNGVNLLNNIDCAVEVMGSITRAAAGTIGTRRSA